MIWGTYSVGTHTLSYPISVRDVLILKWGVNGRHTMIAYPGSLEEEETAEIYTNNGRCIIRFISATQITIDQADDPLRAISKIVITT